MTATAKYRLRITVLRRGSGTQGPSGEKTFAWTAAGSYFAAEDALSAGETITQGIRQSTGFKKLRIKGRSIAIASTDRIKVVSTGEEFEVTGVFREAADTVITVERQQPNAAGQ